MAHKRFAHDACYYTRTPDSVVDKAKALLSLEALTFKQAQPYSHLS